MSRGRPSCVLEKTRNRRGKGDDKRKNESWNIINETAGKKEDRIASERMMYSVRLYAR